MRKIKNKKKSKQNIASNPSQSVNISLPENMSAEEMQHIIANAIIEAEEIKERKRKELEKQKSLEWKKSLGYQDFSRIKHKLWRNIRVIFNRIRIVLTLLFIRKKKLSGDRASVAFLQEFLTMFFGILQALSFVFSIAFIFAVFDPEFFTIKSLGIIEIIWFVFFALLCFLLSCIFRIIRLEVDKINDRNYLFGSFASITSLISIIIAVIAIVKGG